MFQNAVRKDIKTCDGIIYDRGQFLSQDGRRLRCRMSDFAETPSVSIGCYGYRPYMFGCISNLIDLHNPRAPCLSVHRSIRPHATECHGDRSVASIYSF